VQYCAKVLQVIIHEIPGFLWLFKANYFAEFSLQFCDAYCFNACDFSISKVLGKQLLCYHLQLHQKTLSDYMHILPVSFEFVSFVA